MSLTAEGRLIEKRKKLFARHGYGFIVEVDLVHGTAYLEFPINAARRGLGDDVKLKGTYADVLKGINVDIGETDVIIGLEDIGGDIGRVVSRWFEAIEKAERRLARKKSRRAREGGSS